MIRFPHLFVLGCVAWLAGCSSSSSTRLVATPVRQGMTGAQLETAFGRPLHVERLADGGEDWFYRFGSQSREAQATAESNVSETERSYAVGHSTSTTTTMKTAAVHLSPGGKVVGTIPPGSVVVEE